MAKAGKKAGAAKKARKHEFEDAMIAVADAMEAVAEADDVDEADDQTSEAAPPASLLDGLTEAALRNAQAVSEAMVAGILGAEQARAHVADTAIQTLRSQIAAAAELGRATTAQQALQVQAQFAQETWDAYSLSALCLREMLSSAWHMTARPLTVRYAELVGTPAG